MNKTSTVAAMQNETLEGHQLTIGSDLGERFSYSVNQAMAIRLSGRVIKRRWRNGRAQQELAMAT